MPLLRVKDHDRKKIKREKHVLFLNMFFITSMLEKKSNLWRLCFQRITKALLKADAQPVDDMYL